MIVTNSERIALIADIVDVFDDFLTEKGIWLENPDRDDDHGSTNIYGIDFGWLYDDVESILVKAGLIDEN